jgi:hypothetical protein
VSPDNGACSVGGYRSDLKDYLDPESGGPGGCQDEVGRRDVLGGNPDGLVERDLIGRNIRQPIISAP